MWRCLLIFFCAMGVAVPECQSADNSSWDGAYDAATRSRFIPVELWTGSRWEGKQTINLPKADLYFGKRNQKRIVGPIPWTRPGTGEKLMVYRRTNRGKIQLFALRRDGRGLGRVFDSRYDRNCIDAIKFPLGWWKQGDARRFTFECDEGAMTRTVDLTILDIDFRYKGAAHSLRFRWTVDGGRGPGTDYIYTYSPGRGLVALKPV